MDFLNNEMNSSMLLLFQKKIQPHRKTANKMTYIDQRKKIDLIQKLYI